MAAIIQWTRAIAACGLCAWLCVGPADAAAPPSGAGSVVNFPPAGPRPGPVPGPGMAPCTDQCPCVPKVRTWGYYDTRWRAWPGEVRPDKNFPASINKEVLPPPPGQEPIPVPKGTLPLPGGALEGTPGAKPFLPGMGLPKIDSRLPGGGLEEPSEQPKTMVPLPGIEGTLPGLPGLPTPKPGESGADARVRRPRQRTTTRDRTSGRAACRPSIRCMQDAAPKRGRPRPGRLDARPRTRLPWRRRPAAADAITIPAGASAGRNGTGPPGRASGGRRPGPLARAASGLRTGGRPAQWRGPGIVAGREAHSDARRLLPGGSRQE